MKPSRLDLRASRLRSLRFVLTSAGLLALGLAAAGCGSKSDDVAKLQQENDALKAQLQQYTPTTSSPGASPSGTTGSSGGDWSWAGQPSGAPAAAPEPPPATSSSEEPRATPLPRSKRPETHHSSGGDGTNLLSQPEQGTSAPPPPPPPQRVARTLSAGTTLPARLESRINSGSSQVGQSISATLTGDVSDGSGHVVLPAGTKLMGTITSVQPAKRVHKKSSVAFHFDRAQLPDGSTASISAGRELTGKGWTAKQGAIIGGSVAGGALAGSLVGKGGAGALLGGAIAAGVIAGHKGEDVGVDAGTVVDIPLDTSTTVSD